LRILGGGRRTLGVVAIVADLLAGRSNSTGLIDQYGGWM